ncbi:MAG: aromatic ring-hydroxylating dioxygenase subunit alpha [Novosphingobium sp.]|nr:aromatic ring-hydroxylating dioxygenase subunit alpha [Novosphingobium sp.]MCP5401999.1 aromatic ring-hydroxylating dioxygenase subunit alpha [Novosphingobium sp.]
MNIDVASYQPPADQTAWLGTDPIPAKAYYDPDYYELERQAIFMRTWLTIGHVCELLEPGSFIRRDLEFAKASILIVRGKDGVIRGFHNACTHRGTQLEGRGEGKANAFICPYHRWNFGLDGALRSAPDFERFYTTKENCALKPVSVDVCGGMIFVNLDPEPAQSLHEFLGEYIVERLETIPAAKATDFCEYTYEIDANWKLTYDNFQESYHLKFIHPRTGAASYTPENPFGYPENYGFHGVHRSQQFWPNYNPDVTTPVQQTVFPMLAGYATEKGLMPDPTNREYYAVFPGFFIFGSPTQHFSHVVYPISATRSRGVIRLYWVGDWETASDRFAREYCLAIAREVHVEDVNVIKAGQRGLNSGALEHIHFQALEGLCRHLYLVSNGIVEAYKAEQEAAGEAQ